LLYGSDPSSKSPADPYKDMLENLPRITIREYLQDAKLDQMMNLFSDIGSGFKAGSEAAADSNKDGGGGIRKFLSNVGDAAKSAISGGSVLISNIDKAMTDIFKNAYKDSAIGGINKSAPDNSYTKFVLKIPYLLYYGILSSTSTNIYEIPYSGQVLYESSGSNGWKSHNLLEGFETGGKSMLGVLANWVGKNIRVNTTPTWDGASDEMGIKVDIEFSLFNDSKAGALMNFIFVNTIVPGNMWMQYHVFQHAPNLYDIRIEGVKRLFMCSGDFKVEQVGVLRKPSKAFCQELFKYVNSGNIKLDLDTLTDIVRIPDMYKVTCTFTSLLPNNFNNYLYTYYNNDKIGMLKGTNLRKASVLDTVFTDAKKELYTIFKYPKQSKAAFEGSNGSLESLIKDVEADEDKVENAENNMK